MSSTALKNADGLVVSVPNRKVTETTVQNLTKSGHTYDSLSATVTTDKDVGRVLGLVKRAMEACENLSPDHGVSVKKFTHKGATKVVEYRFWWFLKDYENRNKTRDEVFAHMNLAWILSGQGRYQEAGQHYNEVIRIVGLEKARRMSAPGIPGVPESGEAR